jgi:[ribosomal protein S5]-alanine N-acetyltransferase
MWFQSRSGHIVGTGSVSVEIELHPLSDDALRRIVNGLPDVSGFAVAAGALPPPHVARRALDHLAAGSDRLWAVPFNIVSAKELRIVGGCGFKGPPVQDCVELGYGVAASCWRQGYAAAGVSRLLQMAAATGVVREVTAHIAPDNHASKALARHLGFVEGVALVDIDGDPLNCWRWQCPA